MTRRLANQQTTVESAIQLYGELAVSVTPLSTPRAVPNDTDDDQVIACALAAGAKLIVSGDNDLLVLHPWKGIHILNPAGAMQFMVDTNMDF